MITSGEGKYKVFLEKKEIGDDLLYILYGGEKPHMGAMVICEPYKETKVITMGTHKDHIVLQPIAEEACKKYNKCIVACGGIHIDDAEKQEIDIIIKNCKELLNFL